MHPDYESIQDVLKPHVLIEDCAGAMTYDGERFVELFSSHISKDFDEARTFAATDFRLKLTEYLALGVGPVEIRIYPEAAEYHGGIVSERVPDGDVCDYFLDRKCSASTGWHQVKIYARLYRKMAKTSEYDGANFIGNESDGVVFPRLPMKEMAQ